MPDQDILAKSVTKADYTEGSAYYWAIGTSTWNQGPLLPSLVGLTPKESDYLTLSTIDHEAIWAGAVAIALTKVASLAWEIEGEIQLRTKRAHELLMGADAGRGWVSFLSKLLQDYLLTNNGCFIEIVRATKSINSQIIGLIPLDTMRCVRTGDPQKPVCYRDLKGAIHELRAGDVLDFAEMPSSRASMFGTGKCSAARAYTSIYKLACIEQYVADKVSGRRPLAINLINGLNDKQLRDVLNSAQSEANGKGVIAYMGAIIATTPGDSPVNVATIPLADFPDNFNRKEELDIAVLAYADNLGLDVQDIQPLTGRALGTGAQSEVLDEKAKGKGLSSFRQAIVHGFNTWVFPDGTTMHFVENDWRDKNLSATFNKATVEYVTASATGGVISAAQGLQALVDANVYPKEFLPVDETPDTTLSDTEKPETEQQPEPLNTGEPIEQPALEIPTVAPLITTKETTVELIEQEAAEAVKLAKKIRKKVGK